MRRFILLAALTLTACGAGGRPETPQPAAASGVTLSGQGRAGVVVNP